MPDDIRYYAVPDPTDPDLMTYWRERNGTLTPWPGQAKYGPILYRSDVPKGLTGPPQKQWAVNWYRDNRLPWLGKISAAIAADPDEAAARFAALKTRCCWCGKPLTDERSKTIGVGPDCRRTYPDELIARYIDAVGRAHAQHLATRTET